MKCLVCNKSVKQGLRLVKGEKTISTIFCSYSCYKKFWSDVKGFKPLKEAKNSLRGNKCQSQQS